jgi:hypothetical protein
MTNRHDQHAQYDRPCRQYSGTQQQYMPYVSNMLHTKVQSLTVLFTDRLVHWPFCGLDTVCHMSQRTQPSPSAHSHLFP